MRTVLGRKTRQLTQIFGYINEEHEKGGTKKVPICPLTINSEKWIKPKITNTPSHPLFDILLTSLSGGDHRIQEHLERCILQKIYFPGDYRVPTICWKDPGGTGKTLFVDTLLRTIFGGSVHTGSAEWIFSTKANHAIMGKVIVLADDSTITEKRYDNVKRMLHNRVIEIRKQRGNPEYVQNVGWFFISSNLRTPAIPVDGGSADRRFSIIELGYDVLVSQDIIYYIIKGIGKEGGCADKKSAKTYLDDHFNIFMNRNQIAIWLGELVMRRGIPEKEGALDGFQEQSYIDQVMLNRDAYTKTFDLAFLSKVYTRIEADYLRYFHYHVLQAKGDVVDAGDFGKRCKLYLDKHSMLDTYWEKGKVSESRYYRRILVNDEYQRVENYEEAYEMPNWRLAPNEDAWAIPLNQLYDAVDAAYLERLPKPELYPQKTVWSISEIFNTLAEEDSLNYGFYDTLDESERGEIIDSFLTRVRDARSQQIEKTLKFFDHSAIAIPEGIVVYRNFKRETLYQFTARLSVDDKPIFRTNEWDYIRSSIQEWIGASKNDKVIRERKMLKVYLILMEQTQLCNSDIDILKWGCLRKFHKNDLVAEEWLEINDLAEDGVRSVDPLLLRVKLPNRIIFGLNNVVNELYIMWRDECIGRNDDEDYVFSIDRGEPYNFARILSDFRNEYRLYPPKGN